MSKISNQRMGNGSEGNILKAVKEWAHCREYPLAPFWDVSVVCTCVHRSCAHKGHRVSSYPSDLCLSLNLELVRMMVGKPSNPPVFALNGVRVTGTCVFSP